MYKDETVLRRPSSVTALHNRTYCLFVSILLLTVGSTPFFRGYLRVISCYDSPNISLPRISFPQSRTSEEKTPEHNYVSSLTSFFHSRRGIVVDDNYAFGFSLLTTTATSEEFPLLNSQPAGPGEPFPLAESNEHLRNSWTNAPTSTSRGKEDQMMREEIFSVFSQPKRS